MVAALFRRELWLCTVASGTQPGKGQRPGWSRATWPVCGAERSRCTDAGDPQFSVAVLVASRMRRGSK